MTTGEKSIELHREKRGKISIQSKVPLRDKWDLSLAYTPGVAAVSLAVAKDKALTYELTARGNLIAVVSDGSAVLGLGNIGPEGALPVMEGKAILFKELGGVDAVPICLDTQDSQEIISIVKALIPTFGGFNLEDISAPRCFEIEEALMDIGVPVFHDDQHGTAIVVLAALSNALNLVGKSLKDVKIVFSGAGAGGIAVARLLMTAGARNIILVDSRSAIHTGREDLTPVKMEMAKTTNPAGEKGSLSNVMRGADVFVGVSVRDLVSVEDVRGMANKAIVFAMANPDPEILPSQAIAGGAAIVGTGRSDFPNQINNVLAFPGVFRGALDIRATKITVEMKMAAARALAAILPEPTVDMILPSPLDRSVAPIVAKAVGEAWSESQQAATTKGAAGVRR